ncbi:MAG: RIO1 family regulatory kinase/ATPase domain-containing protein [Candidatus Thorarchaeota archaeon]|jgi:RIO kinase 1
MSPGVVEKFNPKKASALTAQRDLERGNRRGRYVPIHEITLEGVRKNALQFGLATDLLYQVSAGKEASIFLAMWKEHPIILKAYRFWTSSQARKKKGYFAPTQMEALAAKEFDVLSLCFKAGVHVPTPIGRVGNYVTMRFIGDGMETAPQLRDVEIDDPEHALDQILDDYLLMYTKAHYVHGDLSRYNILWWMGRPWIIDVPQAYRVDAWADMKRVESLLSRDIRNVLSYFKKYGVRRDADYILEQFISEYTPYNLRNYRESVGSSQWRIR